MGISISGGDNPLFKSRPTLEELEGQWHKNVEFRANELDDVTNQTYFNVIIPNIQRFLHNYVPIGSSVADLGCGLGHLTAQIASFRYKVQGVDIASKAIKHAARNFKNIPFEINSIIGFAQSHPGNFDACVLNMVLQNLEGIDCNLDAVHRLLKPNGRVIASIPHPKTWFTKYFEHKPFVYDKLASFVLPFKIHGGHEHPSRFTYFHRPVKYYLAHLNSRHFQVLYSQPPVREDTTPETDLLFCVWQKI